MEFVTKKNWILFAHNGGRFDWHFILDYIPAENFPDVKIINGRLAQFTIGRCEFRDSFNILPVPLAAYKKDEIDYALMEEPEREKNWDEIISYLRGDCVYLYELIMQFVEVSGTALTIAGASMKYWRTISDKPIPSWRDATSAREFYETFSPYYVGGRVECFEKGIIDADFSVYDINSAYPRAMLEQHPYSTTFGSCDGYESSGDFYSINTRSCGVFPFRPTEADAGAFAKHSLVFPNDGEIRRFHITKWEFQAALEYGLVKPSDVESSIWFDEYTDFAEYVLPIYEARLKARQEKNEGESLILKLRMNGLYGKFAANPESYYNYMVAPPEYVAGFQKAGWEHCGNLGPHALAQAPLADHQKRYYNIATAASITGWVRAYLWRAMRESTGVLYCDTDSIAVRHAGKSIPQGKALGEWKLEGVYKRAGIAGKKLYIFEPVPSKDWIAAGLAEFDENGTLLRKPKKATKGSRITDKEIWHIAADSANEVIYVPEAPTFSPLRPVYFENDPLANDPEAKAARDKKAFTARRIRMTAKQRRISRLRDLWRKRNTSPQMSFDFTRQLTQPEQFALDLL